MSGLIRGAFITALLLAAGCNFDVAQSSDGAPPARTCYDEKLHCDTLRGEICRRADGSGQPLPPTVGEEQVFDGICVLTGTQASGQVFFEFQSNDANAPRTQFGPVSLNKKQNQELFVPEPIAVNGLVTYTNDAQAVEGARVRFKSVPAIPGRSLVFETQSSDEVDSSGRYERLLPQGSYVVTVLPREREEVKPPQEKPFGDKAVSIDASTSRLDLVVSNPNALMSVSGTVLKLTAGREEPAAGVNVWAMSAENKMTKASRAGTGAPIAQPARTGADGSFTLWLPRATNPEKRHQIRLEVGPTSDGAAFPTFRIDDPGVFDVEESMKLRKPILLSNGELGIEAVKARGQVVTPDGAPVAAARISFRTLDDEAFAFATTVLANDDGRFEASLFAGQYQATAIAPEGEKPDVVPMGLCSLESTLTVTNAPVENVVLLCEKRRFIYGRIIDSRGQSVPDVTVSAVRHPDPRSEDQLHEERISDADGHFRLALSPGTYDFTFAPPAAIAPLKSIENVLVDSVQSDNLLVFALDPPFELFGKLFSEKSGVPLGGALDAWVVNPDGQATLVGRGLAQRDGSYSIVLPAIKQ